MQESLLWTNTSLSLPLSLSPHPFFLFLSFFFLSFFNSPVQAAGCSRNAPAVVAVGMAEVTTNGIGSKCLPHTRHSFQTFSQESPGPISERFCRVIINNPQMTDEKTETKGRSVTYQ